MSDILTISEIKELFPGDWISHNNGVYYLFKRDLIYFPHANKFYYRSPLGEIFSKTEQEVKTILKINGKISNLTAFS